MLDLLLVELLLLMRDVAPLTGLAEPVALHGLGQDQRRRALVLDDFHRDLAAQLFNG